MNVLIDSSVWSLAYRRANPRPDRWTDELAKLIHSRRAFMIGPIRQELLSGIRDLEQFEFVRQRLRNFQDIALQKTDYEGGAEFYNRCRARGVQGSLVDFLICAVSVRRSMSIFTIDQDFEAFENLLPIKLHQMSKDR